MTDPTAYDAQADLIAQQRQYLADLDRQGDRFFFRANAMLNAITEDMVMTDRTQAMVRSNVARALVEAAAYAKREASALRTRLFPE